MEIKKYEEIARKINMLVSRKDRIKVLERLIEDIKSSAHDLTVPIAYPTWYRLTVKTASQTIDLSDLISSEMLIYICQEIVNRLSDDLNHDIKEINSFIRYVVVNNSPLI